MVGEIFPEAEAGAKEPSNRGNRGRFAPSPKRSLTLSSGWCTAAKPRADTGALARISLCRFYFGSTLTLARVLDRRARKGIGRPACLMTSVRSPANFRWPWPFKQGRINLRRMPLILVLCGVLQPRPVPTQMWPARIRDPWTGNPQRVLASAEHQLVAKVSAAVPPHAGLCESRSDRCRLSYEFCRGPSELLTEVSPRAYLDLSWGFTLAPAARMP